MMLEGTSDIAANREVTALNWTLTALPRGAKGVATGGGGVGWFIPTASKYHDETWELIKHIVSPEGDRLTYRSAEGMPARRSVVREPEFSSPKEAPGAAMKIVLETLDVTLHTDPILVQGMEVLAAHGTHFDRRTEHSDRRHPSYSAADAPHPGAPPNGCFRCEGAGRVRTY